MNSFKLLLLSTTLLFSFSLFAKIEPPLNAPLFHDLGKTHFPISTKISLAQRFFDQGLVLYYGFEWGESIRSFTAAAKLDPHCGMCYWGIALATGSKINAPLTGHEYQDAKNAIEQALTLTKYTTPKEQAYIRALSQRFAHKPKPSKPTTGVFNCHMSNNPMDASTKEELLNYAQAMKQIIQDTPSDHDAKALYAYTLFEVIEWKFQNAEGVINPRTPLIIETLRSVLDKEPLHVGANHYFVHVIESLPHPEEALVNANRLRTLVPGSEHLIHMPAHIYFLTGRYNEGSTANLRAIQAFKSYNRTCLQQGFKPEINYLYFHNYDFLRTTAAVEGRKELALWAVNELLRPPFSSWLKNESSLQWFMPIPNFVKARFAMWKEILNTKAPDKKYQYALGMWHYAQGMAFAHQKQLKKAQIQLNELSNMVKQGPSDSTLQNNGLNLLKIAEAVLKASLADINNKEEDVINQLKIAFQIQHSMGYHEPPDWYFPLSEALANAYLKWNHPLNAVNMYQQELKQYPKHPWALYGLAKALQQLGKIEEAQQVQSQFNEVWRQADIKEPIFLFNLH